MLPKVVGGILYELNESDEQTPGVWPIHYQSLQQDSCDLLLYGFSISLGKQRKQSAAEVVGVAIRIA